jgi:hypothetical protein
VETTYLEFRTCVFERILRPISQKGYSDNLTCLIHHADDEQRLAESLAYNQSEISKVNFAQLRRQASFWLLSFIRSGDIGHSYFKELP